MVIELSASDAFSLYIHIPFCKRKCDYCHFYVIPDREQHKQLLLQALELEWQSLLPKLPNGARLASIYFGGGTPSLFGPARVAKVLEWIGSFYSLDVEVTLEANPEEIDRSLIADYKSAGVNRISMGVQSLDDHELQQLTRRHDAKKALTAIDEILLAGITNLSIDLMYDLPSQTLSSWKNTLSKACSLPITHLSLYNLTIEPHTVFYKYKNQLTKSMPDQTTSFDMYTLAIEELEKKGLLQYEISAFAREGLYSRHNTGYWTGRPFLGLGPSAYSFWKNVRYKNVANINKYAQALQEGLSPIDTIDELPEEERKRELLVIALRLLDGVDIAHFERLHGALLQQTKTTLLELTENELFTTEESRIKLTQKGIYLYDSIAVALI